MLRLLGGCFGPKGQDVRCEIYITSKDYNQGTACSVSNAAEDSSTCSSSIFDDCTSSSFSSSSSSSSPCRSALQVVISPPSDVSDCANSFEEATDVKFKGQAPSSTSTSTDTSASTLTSNLEIILQPHKRPLTSRQIRQAMRKADPDSLYSSSHSTSSDHAQLLPYLLQHGRCIMSLSTFQPGMYHFVMPGIGYMAYGMIANGPNLFNIFTPVCLSDPVCHPSHYETMARAFLRRFPKAMFLQISASFALVLRSCGLLVNSVGGETQLDLATYTLSGHAKRGLRSAIASAVKQGVAVEEVMHSDVTGCAVPGGGDWSVVAAEMREVDASWVAHKGQHAARVWFLNRLPVFGPEIGVRKFIARDSYGKLLAFIFFDAVYEAGSVVGYYANVTRMRPDAHPGVLNLIMREFIDRVRSESQLAAPTKKTSMKKSQRKKLEATAAAGTDTGSAAAAAAAATAAARGNEGPTPTSTTASGGSSCGVRFVSLGLSPFFQMDDSRFKHSSRVRELLEFAWNEGAAFYPSKSLAAAKAKYGGGLHNGEYADPAVTYHQVYLAHTHHHTASAAMFDLGRMLGFWNLPIDAVASLAKHKMAAAADKAHKGLLKHKKKQQWAGVPEHKCDQQDD